MDQVIADEAEQKGVGEEGIRENYTRSVSLRTFIEADDIAHAARFVASPSVRCIIGPSISVDGHLEAFGGIDI